MIKGFSSGNYEMSVLFSNWNNFDKILDLIDDYVEVKEQIEEKNNTQKTIVLNRIQVYNIYINNLLAQKGAKHDKNFYNNFLWRI